MTSGPARASASNSLRTAQKVSSLVPPPAPPSPSASATRSAISSAFSSPASRAAIVAADCSPGSRPSRARDLPDNLGQRPIGDALAVGQAAAAQDRHVAGEPAGELPHKPRLADARAAEHGQQVAGPVSRPRVPKTGVEHGTLALAPDEGRVEAARKAGGVGEDVYHDEGVDRLAVLERARAARLDDDRVAHEPVRRPPDQDLVRRRRLLEALGDVDGLSGDKQMSLRCGRRRSPRRC